MQTKSLIPASWDVPDEFRDRLGQRVGRQRAMIAEGHLLLILHAPPQADDEERVGCLFWRNSQGEWESSDHGSGPNCVSKHLHSYEEAVEKLDHLESQSEGAALGAARRHKYQGMEFANRADDYFVLLESLLPLHRATSHLYQVLQEARKAIPEDRDLINCRDLSYDLERQAQLLYSGAKNALDFDIARRAEQQAKLSHKMATASHRLNLLAGFFFPVATLSAIFGVNMKHPFQGISGTTPFLWFVCAGLFTGILLTVFMQQPAVAKEQRS